MQSKRNFQSARYLDLSQDHLVVLALWFLIQEKKQSSFENLVAEAFTSFPERFLLEGYPEWPNAHVIGKAWVRCRTDKKWISGSASVGFKLTPLGEQIAQKVLADLQGTSSPEKDKRRKGSRQTISSRVVLRVESSEAYLKYKEDGIAKVSEYDFCDLLYCTLESMPETVENNFLVVKQEVQQYGRKDLTEFLEQLKNRFAEKFTGKRVRGGMMPQKKEG
jgi:hypothetical protein